MLYQQQYQNWADDREGFWGAQAARLDWQTPPQKIFESNASGDRWYVDGVMNTCFNCVDRHVAAGHGARIAFIHDSPITDSKSEMSYAELLDRVELVAAIMADKGVSKGDRVIIYMPMIVETAIAALACARLGAIHSIVFGGFAAAELATRIDDAKPRLILAASCGLEPGRIIDYKPLLDGAIELAAHRPDACLIWQRPQQIAPMIEGRDFDWQGLEAAARAADNRAPCVPVAATDPLYILYTSGTTGIPKGVVRDNGGHLVALSWAMENIYNIGADDVFWSASDFGWVVGHSFILYAPLAVGATSVIYEGKPVGTPDAGAFWRVISEHGVKALFTAPTAFRAIKKEDPKGKLVEAYDMRAFEMLYLAGERVDPDTINWAEATLGVPVIDNCGRPKPAGRFVPIRSALNYCPLKRAHPVAPCRAMSWLCSMRVANRWVPMKPARLPLNCRCRPAVCLAYGKTEKALKPPIWPIFRAIIKPATPVLSMKTAIFTSCRALMTLSMWQVTGCQPVRWKRFWPRMPILPNVPCWALMTRLRVKCRSVFWF